ncbi:MAG: isoprenyl transferase [Crocinitomicaceae bacterium]
METLEKINLEKVPAHIAVIMDGNGRWAKQQGHERLYGHNFGVESVRELLKGAQELKVKYLTIYAFSTENWNRPKEEVEGLMDLLVKTIANEIEELNEKGIRLLTIGDTEGLPDSCRDELKSAIKKTANNTETSLILALNYSSRWEIVEATKRIANDAKNGEINPIDISADLFSSYLSTKNIPDPELVVRTSGEQRISNFLLWQIAYSEFFFTDILWPDFKKETLFQAVYNYQNRERRFGMVSEQLSK